MDRKDRPRKKRLSICNYIIICNYINKFRMVINFSKNNNCCIEGRDIATKILPNSDLKFFFKCSLDTAAKRRFKELFDYSIEYST